MKNISTTYIAGAVGVIAFVLPLIGLDVSDTGLLKSSIQELIGALAIFYTFYGRFKAGGISKFGIRKDK